MTRSLTFARRKRPSASQAWTIEPLRRGDTTAVTELFDALSARSRLQRFLSPVPRLTGRMLSHLSDVDGVRHIAVTARVGGRCVGIARAIALREDPSVAELAVAVADAHHGEGLGRRLLDRLALDAAALGIRTFEATVHPGNDAARALARAVGAAVSHEEGLVRVEWKLPGAPALPSDAASLATQARPTPPVPVPAVPLGGRPLAGWRRPAW